MVRTGIIRNGNSPLCLVNYDLLINREDKFSGHYLILRELTKRTLYGDTGPISFYKLISKEKEKFLGVWKKMCWFDYDTIILRL